MWNTSDKFIQGIPDTCLTFRGICIGWEAKFITEMPKRATSQVLKREVTGPQLTFLQNNILAGGTGVVVVGSEDDALFLLPSLINFETGNITKADLMKAAELPGVPRVKKIKGVWQLEGILERMLELRGCM